MRWEVWWVYEGRKDGAIKQFRTKLEARTFATQKMMERLISEVQLTRL